MVSLNRLVSQDTQFLSGAVSYKGRHGNIKIETISHMELVSRSAPVWARSCAGGDRGIV